MLYLVRHADAGDRMAWVGDDFGRPLDSVGRMQAEGAHVAAAFDLVRSLAAAEGDAVLCSHGDVIPALLWVLAQYGLDMPERRRCKKGSIWELEVSDGRLVGATYRHPRTFGAA